MPTLEEKLSAHQKRSDNGRVWGLVLQGGGMRAVYSAAAIGALIKNGFVDTFDHVVGSSAGALNACYFLAIQPEAVKTYTEDLTNKKFVDMTRSDKKVDIDYMVDALKEKHPLALTRLIKSPSKLHIVLTDASTGRLKVVTDHQKFANIYEEMRATAALPILYDKKIKIDGVAYIDGGVADLLPLDVAIGLGCTDILVIMTQQISSYRFDARHKRLVKNIIRYLAKNQAQKVRRILPTNERLLKRNLKLLTSPPDGVNIYVLEPSDEEILVSMATIERDKIVELAKLGRKDMAGLLAKEN